MDVVGTERERTADARVTGRDRCDDHAERERERDGTEHPPGAPALARHLPQHDREAERHHRPRQREPPELGLHHLRDGAPGRGLAQRQIARRRRLKHDPRQCHHHKRKRDHDQPTLHLFAHLAARHHQHHHQRHHTADEKQHQRVVQEAPAGVERRDHERRVLEHLRGDALRLWPGFLDVEDEGAVDRVRVGGDHPPRHGVRAPLQPTVERDRDTVARWPLDLARVDLAALAVVDTDGAESALDGLVEAQHDAVGRFLDDGVVGRCGL